MSAIMTQRCVRCQRLTPVYVALSARQQEDQSDSAVAPAVYPLQSS